MPASCICIQAMPTTVLDLGSGQLALVSGLGTQLIKPLCVVEVQCGQCWMLPSDLLLAPPTTRAHHLASRAASPDTLGAPRPNLIPSRTEAHSQLITSLRAARCLFSVSNHPQCLTLCLTLVSHFPVLAVHMRRIVSEPSPSRHRLDSRPSQPSAALFLLLLFLPLGHPGARLGPQGSPSHPPLPDSPVAFLHSPRLCFVGNHSPPSSALKPSGTFLPLLFASRLI